MENAVLPGRSLKNAVGHAIANARQKVLVPSLSQRQKSQDQNPRPFGIPLLPQTVRLPAGTPLFPQTEKMSSETIQKGYDKYKRDWEHRQNEEFAISRRVPLFGFRMMPGSTKSTIHSSWTCSRRKSGSCLLKITSSFYPDWKTDPSKVLISGSEMW